MITDDGLTNSAVLDKAPDVLYLFFRGFGSVKSFMKTGEASRKPQRALRKCLWEDLNTSKLFFNKILCALMIKTTKKNQKGF